jgi:LysR family transcriptional regulator, transcriptional activator of nhaA
MSTLNYRHLHYFWVVAKEGGFARAAERLDMAVQTVSAQVRELERSLGHQLLKPVGRGFSLTEAGEAAFVRAEEIFRIGQGLPAEVREAASHPSVRFAVGLSDGLSKLAAHALLGPVLATPNLRLLCHEGEFEQLQAELALHHLDIVLAGQPAPPNATLRLSSERLASSPVDWYGPGSLVRRADVRHFPACLADLPVLLPTAHASMRPALDRWFEQHGLRPRVVGEFEDSALLAVFATQGLGVFPVSRLGVQNLLLLRGLRLLGRTEDLREDIYAIRSRRGLHHPLARKLIEASRASTGAADSS